MSLPSPLNPTGGNPSYGYTSENLTDAEIAADKAEREHEGRLEELEQDVISEAIAWHNDDGNRTPLANAVESLIREREGK